MQPEKNLLKIKKELLHTILSIINRETINFKAIPHIDKIISTRYQQQLTDVREWLSLTEWSQGNINESIVNTVQKRLLSLDIIDHIMDYNSIVKNISVNVKIAYIRSTTY